MATRNGTFGEVSAWLTAYAAGMTDVDKEAAKPWYEFTDWLLRRLDYPSNYFWSAALREVYPDDETAIRQLRLLYIEYEETCFSDK